MALRKVAFVVLTGAAIVLAIGYCTAWLSVSKCVALTNQDFAQRRVVGQDFSGREVLITGKDVTARATAPFIVETSYSVPTGMHASIHRKKYFVLPWLIKLHSSKTYHLL